MRVRRLICVLAITATILTGNGVSASSRDQIPQTSYGVTVRSLNSNSEGATLAVQTAEYGEIGESGRPFSSGLLWALPYSTTAVRVQTRNEQWRSLNPGELPDTVISAMLADPKPLVAASRVMTMRAMNFASLAVNALQPTPDGQGLRVCVQCQFDMQYVSGGLVADTRKLSRSFYELARGVAANLDEVIPAPEVRPESYLIITRPAYLGAALNSFVDWKRTSGHTVRVATTDATGTTNQSIKNYILNAYNTLEEPPVFVVLIGDVDGTNPMPAWEEPGYYHPWDVSDHPYTLLDGDDWLPDVFIGRLSVDSGNEFQTVINKCVNYESQPYQPSGGWRSRMLITGVRSSPTYFPTYNSSWPTLQWISRQFVERGFTEIDSVPNPPGTASQISAAVNNGVSFIGYRGFGEPDGWWGPGFNVSNVQALSNGQMLPVVTSIVCGGGAFDDPSVDPCFGEAWLRAGTPANPKGAIGFIGPSELDTKTRWNNTNIAGIYEGILFENVQTLGAAMLRGKLELMREFPNNVDNMNADPDRSVSFYFYCYNLLGDPGLAFFVGPAQTITATLPDTVAMGTPTLSFGVTENSAPLSDAWATVKLPDSVFSRAVSDSSGNINLALPQGFTGDVQVTLTKPRHAPQQFTVHLTRGAANVAARDIRLIDNSSHNSIGNGDGLPDAGEHVAFGVILHNYGTGPSTAGTLTVSSENNAISVVNGQAAIPTLAPGADTDTLFLLINVAPSCGDGQTGRLTWTVTPGTGTWETSLDIHAPRLSVTTVRTNGSDSNPIPRSTSRVALGITNLGRSTMPASSITLRSQDSRLVISDSIVAYPAIPSGQTVQPASQGFQISVGNIYPGDWVQTDVIAASAHTTSPISFPLPIGNLQGGDPTHPDTYGYRAFQSSDSGYAETPAYAWMEIDPTRGGNGMILNVPDTDRGRDTTVRVALPFDFTFYGTSYDHVAICSNGFLSFGQTAESYFRNYSLPAIASPDNMVCVFWDDLAVPPTGHICTYHDTEGGRFIIEWSHVVNEFDLTEETFQVLLFDTACWRTRTGDGDLLMQYQDFNNVDTWDNYCTIGIQDRDHGHALPITYANQWSPGVSFVRSQQSILFTTGRPQGAAYFGYAGNVIDDDTTGGSHGNGDGIPQNGETIQLAVRLQNTGNSAAPSQSGTLRSADPYITLLDSALTFPSIAPGDSGVSGSVRVNIHPSAPDAHVCNFALRFSGNVTPCVVLPSLRVYGPALIGLTPIIDDDSIPPSHGNNNHEFNPGETVELFPGARNTGGNIALAVHAKLRTTSNRISIVDSVALLGDLPPDSQRYGTNPLVLHVSQQAADGAPFSVQIILSDSFGTTWQYSQSYITVIPNLSISGVRISDPPPGGNGNHLLELGESGDIYPQVTNSGTGMASDVSLRLRSRDSLVTLLDSVVSVGIVSGNSTREPSSPIRVQVSPNGAQPRGVTFDVTITGSNGLHVADQMMLMIGSAALFDDFESSVNYWSHYGTLDEWHLQSRQYHSPTHAYYCGSESGNHYSALANGYLRSPQFPFNGTGTLVLSTRYETADGGDIGHVQLQTGPSDYQTLAQWTGSSQGWQEMRLPLEGLPAYQNAQIRFWFSSDGSGEAEGWYIDDVILVEEPSRVGEPIASLPPDKFELVQNYPNPFNDQTTIQYGVPHTSRVHLSLFNLEGRRVATLVDELKSPGNYRVSYRPIGLASGLYFVRLDTPDVHLTAKIAYLK